MGRTGGLLFKGQEGRQGRFLLSEDGFEFGRRVGMSGARGHLRPCNFAFDDAWGIAVVPAGGPEFEAVSGAGVGAGGMHGILLGLGEGDALEGGGVVLGGIPDRETDASASGGGGVRIDSLQAGLLDELALGGRDGFLVFELMRVDEVAGGGLREVIVVDGLVDFYGLAKIEHFTFFVDLRFINNNDPFYLG